MATDYLGMLGQGLNYAQIRDSFGDARDNLQEGFGDARRDLRDTQEPYSQFGLDSMQNYQDQGDFSFSNEDFYRDPSYQFRMDESMEQLQRSQAAKKMLSSTGTLGTMQERAGDLASQEYQAAFDRAKDTYGMNLDRNKFGVQTGAQVAMNLGNNLADIGIGEGAALASMNASEARLLSNVISSTLASMGQPSDPNAVSGMINEAISSGIGSVGDFIGGITDKLGGAISGGLSALGFGGAALGDTMLGTAAGNTALQWGTGGLDAALGGAGTATSTGASTYGGGTAGAEIASAQASGASAAATTGFASWASTAAVGVGAIMAVRSVVDMLRGDSAFTEAMGDLAKSKDPLGDIKNMAKEDLPRDTMHTQNNWSQLSDSASRGAMYSGIFMRMEPEQLQGLKFHQDINSIVGDMLAYTKSGQGDSDGLTNPTKALKLMFPEISSQIDTMGAGAGQELSRTQYEMTQDGGTDYWALAMGDYWQSNVDRGEAAAKEVNTYINQQLREWRYERTAEAALGVLA